MLNLKFVQEWASSAVGSAREWHSRGHRFDPGLVHQPQQFPSDTSDAIIDSMAQLIVRNLDEEIVTRLRQASSAMKPWSAEVTGI